MEARLITAKSVGLAPDNRSIERKCPQLTDAGGFREFILSRNRLRFFKISYMVRAGIPQVAPKILI